MSKQERQIKMRLGWFRHVEEITHNVAQTCRYFGIARKTYYKWYNRYIEEGMSGLIDRSTRPHHCPKATKAEVVEKIIYLRKNYHFGPTKIQMYLERYHDIKITAAGVYVILKRLGMNRLPQNQRYKSWKKRYKKYEKPLPGHSIQVDVKFLQPIPGVSHRRYYQYTAIDDCTRIRVMRIYDRITQKNAIKFVDYVLSKLPFKVEEIKTDNGSEFGPQFHWHILDKGINHVYIKPRTPRLNGKVERAHRIDEEEFYRMLNGIVIDSTELFNEKLKEWENFYNYHRPHGSLKGKTPYEKLREKLSIGCNR